MKFSVGLLALAAGTVSAAAALPPYKSPKTKQELDAELKKLGLHVNSDQGIASKVDASDCSKACASLAGFKSKGIVLPSSSAYDTESASYWSDIQAEQTPACYFLPAFPNDVLGAVLTAEFYKCPFAVKSGGHAAFAGASNIDNGITIDLKQFTRLKVSSDKKVASIGTGLTWGDVYSTLDSQGLSVVGGRVSGIGTGGLTLGGGISFFSGRYGWACDNVVNYQVVMGGGRILEVNESSDSYPDLYRALRGGGNNFGIVTRFDLITHTQGKMWGGLVTYDSDKGPQIYKALTTFTKNGPSDPDAHAYVALAYADGKFIYSNSYDYAKPIANPPIFKPFTKIASAASTTRITSLHDLTNELNKLNPSGLRETYHTATYTLDNDLLNDIDAIFRDEAAQLSDVSGYLPALEFQPISKNTAQHFHKRGGNSLGISKSATPLFIINISVMWANAADDDRVQSMANSVIRRSNNRAKTLGLRNAFIYQNYASASQKVFLRYGQKNLRALKAASRKYDPRQVFQTLEPGYFKLSST